ncbi:asparagine synthetase [Actinomortierella wolfii]|nr:asparagine synthetase [Actinomortierella wolfii]
MRVKNLHYADCLRANKSTMAWGVEARVPFLDKAFLEVALNINPEEKVFDKERGRFENWIDSLKEVTEKRISDEVFAKAAERWPKDTPKTKEAYYYREVFEKWFPQEACTESVVRWIPREDWGCPADPSGRAQKVHDAAYDKTA